MVRYVVRIVVRQHPYRYGFFLVRYVIRTTISKNWKNKGSYPDLKKPFEKRRFVFIFLISRTTFHSNQNLYQNPRIKIPKYLYQNTCTKIPVPKYLYQNTSYRTNSFVPYQIPRTVPTVLYRNPYHVPYQMKSHDKNLYHVPFDANSY